MAFKTMTWVRINAFEGGDAFLLEQRLRHLNAAAVGRGETWWVELEDDGDRLDEILVAIRRWLRDVDREAAAVWVGDEERVVRRHEAGEPLGAGYDAASLEHDP